MNNGGVEEGASYADDRVDTERRGQRVGEKLGAKRNNFSYQPESKRSREEQREREREKVKKRSRWKETRTVHARRTF